MDPKSKAASKPQLRRVNVRESPARGESETLLALSDLLSPFPQLVLKTGGIVNHVMATVELPIELLLDILELLLAERGKSSYRAAAGLAQACRRLRTSEAGKRARYFYALALRSMSVPSSLPVDLDYEIEVLCASRWPFEDPFEDPDEQRQVFQLGARYFNGGAISGEEDAKLKADAQAMDTALEFLLHGDTIIALDATGKKLLVGVARAMPMAQILVDEYDDRAEHNVPSHYSIARPEAIALHKVIQLDSKVTKMAVDSDDGKTLALVYAEPEDKGKVTVEMRSLESGDIVASFVIRHASVYDDLCSIEEVKLMGDYLQLVDPERTEVRRWRTGATEKSDMDWPILWESPEDHASYGVWLLAPHFMATTEQWAVESVVEFHRLDQTMSTVVAICEFPDDFYEEDALDYVVCGSRIAPGEEGLVVIQINGTAVSCS